MKGTMNRDQTLVALALRQGIGTPSLISMLHHLCVLWMIVDHGPQTITVLAHWKNDHLSLVFIDLMTVPQILVHTVR